VPRELHSERWCPSTRRFITRFCWARRYRWSRPGLFPKAFQRRTRRATPGVALLTSGLLISGLIAMNSSKGLIRAYTFINLMATLASVVPYAQKVVAGHYQDSLRATRTLSAYCQKSPFPVRKRPPRLHIRTVKRMFVQAAVCTWLQAPDVVRPVVWLEVNIVMPGCNATVYRGAAGEAVLLRQQPQFLVC
jgi:hypothetical protein